MEQIKLSKRGEKVNYAGCIKRIKENHPDAWRHYQKRIYKNVDQFNDYRIPAYYKFALAAAVQNDVTQPSSFIASELVNLKIAEKYDFPSFFISKELLQACFETNAPEEVDWAKMRLPFPSFTFILPKQSLFLNDEEVLFFELCRSTPDEVRSIKDLYPLSIDEPKLVITATLESGGTVFKTFNTPYIAGFYGKDIEDMYSDKMNATEKEFGGKICATVFNILFVMAARPELMEIGGKLGRVKKSNAELWTPNIIGRKYTVKRPEGYESGGAGTHKRMHWRRGHFRHQPYGAGLTETKIIWLEPMLIGAKTAEV